MRAADLHERDARIRKRLGWGPMAFIGPRLPRPRTKAERIAREILEEHHPGKVLTLHVYDVLEILEHAWRAGRAPLEIPAARAVRSEVKATLDLIRQEHGSGAVVLARQAIEQAKRYR